MDGRFGGLGDSGIDDLRHFGTTQLESAPGGRWG